MANKSYTVEKEIGGVKYVAQFAGLSVALKAADETYIDGTSNTSLNKMAEYLFKYIVVEPKNLHVDDFDTLEELNEVVSFASGVMRGEFRDSVHPGEAETKGKK